MFGNGYPQGFPQGSLQVESFPQGFPQVGEFSTWRQSHCDMGYWSYPQGFPQAGRDGQTFGVFAAGWGRGSGPHHTFVVVCVSFRRVPCLVL